MSIFSMTGYGDASRETDNAEISVEVRSVNHRFLDVNFKLPGLYNRYETTLNKLVRSLLVRGRVDIYVQRQAKTDAPYDVVFKKELFQDCFSTSIDALKDVSLDQASVSPQVAANLLSRREIVDVVYQQIDPESEVPFLKEALKAALENLITMRRDEGVELEKDLSSYLKSLRGMHKKILKRASSLPDEFEKKLNERLKRRVTSVQIDEERLAQEVALLADRIDISEELARLNSHFLQFEEILKAGGGRKLEFLLQEFTREVNTIGSKAQDAEITSLVVDAKSVIEKLREQSANIE